MKDMKIMAGGLCRIGCVLDMNFLAEQMFRYVQLHCNVLCRWFIFPAVKVSAPFSSFHDCIQGRRLEGGGEWTITFPPFFFHENFKLADMSCFFGAS